MIEIFSLINEFVDIYFPESQAIALTGSSIDGKLFPERDLDIIIISNKRHASYFENFQYKEYKIDIIFFSTRDLHQIIFSDINTNSGRYIGMLAKSLIVKDYNNWLIKIKIYCNDIYINGSFSHNRDIILSLIKKLRNNRKLLITSNNSIQSFILGTKIINDLIEFERLINRKWETKLNAIKENSVFHDLILKIKNIIESPNGNLKELFALIDNSVLNYFDLTTDITTENKSIDIKNKDSVLLINFINPKIKYLHIINNLLPFFNKYNYFISFKYKRAYITLLNFDNKNNQCEILGNNFISDNISNSSKHSIFNYPIIYKWPILLLNSEILNLIKEFMASLFKSIKFKYEDFLYSKIDIKELTLIYNILVSEICDPGIESFNKTRKIHLKRLIFEVYTNDQFISNSLNSEFVKDVSRLYNDIRIINKLELIDVIELVRGNEMYKYIYLIYSNIKSFKAEYLNIKNKYMPINICSESEFEYADILDCFCSVFIPLRKTKLKIIKGEHKITLHD